MKITEFISALQTACVSVGERVHGRGPGPAREGTVWRARMPARSRTGVAADASAFVGATARGGAAALLLGVALAGCSANGALPVTTTPVVDTPPVVTAPVPTVTVVVTPQTLEANNVATITWNSTHATSCEATGGWSGTQAVSNSSGVSTGVLGTGTYTFGLTCSGDGGSASASQVVFVGAVAEPTVDLDLTPTAIQPGDSASLTWSSTNGLTCTASGGTGADGWAGTQGAQSTTAFNTGPITTAGEYSYTLTCNGPGGSGSASRILDVQASAPAAPPAITFSAQPTHLLPGGSSTLTWTVANATACTASGGAGSEGWSGPKPVASTGTGVGPIATAGTYTYTLTCTGNGGTNSQSLTLAVSSNPTPPAVTAQMTVSPSTLMAGHAAFLSWTSANADSCLASGSWGGTQPTSGSAISTGTIGTAGVYSYTLNCTGAGGSATSTATLTVNPAPAAVTNFAASPTNIQVGQSTALSWSTTEATSCAAGGGTGSDGWTGAKPTSGAGVSVGPLNTAGTYTYTLTCTGPGGTSAPSPVTVTVSAGPTLPAAAVVTFLATPTTIQAGQSTLLTWVTTNATRCTATGGSGSDSWTGAEPTASLGTAIGPLNTAGTYTYTLTCTGPGGTSAPSALDVNVGAATPAAALVSFIALPTALQTGQSTTLTWVSTNATSCTATGGTGSDGWSGTQQPLSVGTAIGPLNTAGTYTYTLLCTGPGGASAPTSANVTVSAGPPLAGITALVAIPSAIQVGQSITLTWATTHALSCTATGGTGSDGWNGSKPILSVGTVIGPLNTAGSYTYTLTCTGLGGTSAPAAVTVTVSAGTPPATLGSLTATPAALQTGQSTTLAWSASNATACTATGGSGADVWVGALPVSSTGLVIGPLTIAGAYTYTLTCTGPGGTSAPRSVTVTVTAPTPPATVTSLTATPSTIQVGQSTTLSWASSNATSCLATGGAGLDGWLGTEPLNSSGQTVGPLAVAGTYTYLLTCNGPGGTGTAGSVTVTATAPPPGQPTVSLTANNVSSVLIPPGQSVTLKWSATNATACTASGGSGADSWSGSQGLASSSTVIGPLNTPGIYTYTLSCSGPGGTGSASVTVTVISSTSADCGIGTPTTALLAPSAAATGGIHGLCLLGCSVSNLSNLTDASQSNFASLSVALGVAASASVRVTDSVSFPAGRLAGFLVADPAALLSLTLLQNIKVDTLLNGTLQESASVGNLLTLQALGLFSNPKEAFVGFTTSKPFNAVQLDLGQLAAVLSDINVYGSCVSLQ